MSFVDPDTRLTEPELDREKQRAHMRMVGRRDRVIWSADMLASRAYKRAHLAVLGCRTEAQIVEIEEAFNSAMTAFAEVLDAIKV
ncbi:hypothetical protein [Reyranella massiliensis]|uniref:hypothetical protein n=1 Tax=Reyranella massiliensis TaxID=445220 RepID=UPI0002EDB688|nr:hypothetical protein [Reyranella massiliensis]